MPRKSEYDKLRDAIQERLRQLDPMKAMTVEEAVANEQTICNAFGMQPSEPGTYDLCPTHNRIRYRGQCPACPE